MGIIQLEKRYADIEPYYYEPWWERTSDATRIGIYVAIVILVVVSICPPSQDLGRRWTPRGKSQDKPPPHGGSRVLSLSRIAPSKRSPPST